MKTESDKKKSGISAIILCGGKSTAMGKDKAGLLIGKKTFLQQIEEHVSGADEVLLSVKDRRDYPEIEARHIEDLEQDNDRAGMEAIQQIRKEYDATRYIRDASQIYSGCKDLNEYLQKRIADRKEQAQSVKKRNDTLSKKPKGFRL